MNSVSVNSLLMFSLYNYNCILYNRIEFDLFSVITGSTRDKVVLARHQVDLLLKNSNRRDVYTHFLSIPLTDKTIMANYTQFKTTVLNETGKNSRGVCEKLFKKPEKLHLCIGMLVLTNDEEIKMAIRTLQECNEQVIK